MNASDRNGREEEKPPLQRIADNLIETWAEFYPVEASRRGMHEWDGELPSLDTETAEELRGRLQTYRGALQQHPVRQLDPPEIQLRHLLLWAIDSVLYDRVQDPSYQQNPLRYLRCVDWSRYTLWEYAEKERRVRALTEELRQLPPFLETARSRLNDRQHPVLVRKARRLIRGKLDYLQGELSRWVGSNAPDSLHQEFERCRREASSSLKEFDRHLEESRPADEEEVVLGDSSLSRFLAMTERVDEPLDELERAGVHERERLQNRVNKLLDELGLDDPRQALVDPPEHGDSPEQLPRRAKESFNQLLETLGSGDELGPVPDWDLRVESTPEHLRTGFFARLYAPGPFDDPSLPSYYYLTPPDPEWEATKRRQWLRFFHPHRLSVIGAHECFPGHLFQLSRIRETCPPRRRIFWSYGMLEGWAHYAEELALKHWPDPDPRLRLVQVEEALIRVVRYLTSLRFHGGRCSLEEASKWFENQAYLSPATARQEAHRVLHDPGYLNYTLGKFQLRSLRARSDVDSDAAFVDRLFERGWVPPALVEQAWTGETP